MIKTQLSFQQGNAKLAKSIATFSLPAGHSCPFAFECLSKSNRETGHIKDGPFTKFRCFAASDEARSPSVRNSRWGNYNLLRACTSLEAMANLIQDSIPKGTIACRVHVSGDFFSERYFLAWLNVSLNNPQIVFYGYTKATPFIVNYRKYLPHNFRFTASHGGTRDDLISAHSLKSALVVLSVEEAITKGLEIDHNDSLAYGGQNSFALLIHGTQPVGTKANEAWKKLTRQGIWGYGKSTVHEKKKDVRIYVSPLTFKTTKSKVSINANLKIKTRKSVH